MLLAIGQVGAIHGEAGRDLGDGVVRMADARHESRDAQDLGVKDAIGDAAPGVVDQVDPVQHGSRAQTLLERVEPLLSARVDEQPIEIAQGVVAGRARRLPVRRQLLVALEDLLRERRPHP